ncbi:tRNA pseudouridine55 synthase [Microbacterium sp. AK009]|uniref:tRNA pseudouridine(55) synthase TruB n=1 Tax=Microbacterium sp. AK009 TaxID=2723068 RepID=UPI0015CC8336|nr:tRNA pseudouridine(55) synthase TruB [Microbacterium sp. AK009]NYF16482.1 tRNA pseudouridine55 synthase [Microbacterium sp. AK009]
MAGILLVDKPSGITSHDVVARARRARGTRKVGHAGTLDPMATGLLVLGVDAATRLLTFVVGLDKTYEATIRLGEATTTDDADGETTTVTDASGVTAAEIETHLAGLRGSISQVPSTYSAIKVDGRRAYDLARAGEEVRLAAREVTVFRLEVTEERRTGTMIDLDVTVDCSSGTYVRSLARDLGVALGVGGHLTALRRTRIGPFMIADAVGVDDLAEASPWPPAEAAAAVLGALGVTAAQARDLRHGKRLAGIASALPGPRAAAIDPDGALVGIVERRGDDIKSVVNMPEEVTG